MIIEKIKMLRGWTTHNKHNIHLRQVTNEFGSKRLWSFLCKFFILGSTWKPVDKTKVLLHQLNWLSEVTSWSAIQMIGYVNKKWSKDDELFNRHEYLSVMWLQVKMQPGIWFTQLELPWYNWHLFIHWM